MTSGLVARRMLRDSILGAIGQTQAQYKDYSLMMNHQVAQNQSKLDHLNYHSPYSSNINWQSKIYIHQQVYTLREWATMGMRQAEKQSMQEQDREATQPMSSLIP